MRLLLTGGLMTQDVVTRHRNQQTTNCNSSMGGPWSTVYRTCFLVLSSLSTQTCCSSTVDVSNPRKQTLFSTRDHFDWSWCGAFWQHCCYSDHACRYLAWLYSCLSHGEIPGTDDSTPHNGDAGISNRDVSDGIYKNGHLLLVPLKVASFVGSVGNLCGKFVIEDERSAKSRALRLIFLKRTG